MTGPVKLHPRSIRQVPLHSVRDVAGLLGVSEKTVRREIASGELIAVRLGPAQRRIGIPADEVERYLRMRSTWAPMSIKIP